MLQRLKEFFTTQLGVAEGFGGFIEQQVGATLNEGVRETVSIVPYNGKFALKNGGFIIQTYARERDAIRGAKRRGLTVA